MEDTRHDTHSHSLAHKTHAGACAGSKEPGNAGDSSAGKVSDGMRVQGGDPIVDWG